MLRVGFNSNARNQIESVQPLTLAQLTDQEQDEFAIALDSFNQKVWRSRRSDHSSRYSLAILYDPIEKFPPSDKQAMRKFLEVVKRMNIHTELITE